MCDPTSSRADRRSLLTDVPPSSQTPARARTRRTGDGATSGDRLDFRCGGGDGGSGAADSRGGTSDSRKTGDRRRARCEDRARGGRHPVPLGRSVADDRLRLLRARTLGVRAGRHRRAAQLVRLWITGRAVERSRMAAGDVLVFSGFGHVGLYLGGGRMVHAPYTGKTRRDRRARELELRFSPRRRAPRRSCVSASNEDDHARVDPYLARGLPKVPYRRPPSLRGSPSTIIRF